MLYFAIIIHSRIGGYFVKISEKILRIRVELDLSQEALARDLNVSFATINRWENEKTVPSRRAQLLIDDYCKKHEINLDAWENSNGRKE